MRRARSIAVFTLVCAAPAFFADPAEAKQFAREADLSWESIAEETGSFFSNLFLGGVDEDGDGSLSVAERANAGVVRAAVAGSVLVGITGGLLGSFVIMRRMALFGDMLGHAVLPGVAIGFIVAGRKSTGAMLLGALGAGLAAAALTRAIRAWSRVKEDAALGISLSFFYALGVWLLYWITRTPELSAEASGLDQYLFGNPAVINPPDLWALGITSAIVVGLVWGGYKELLASTFDPSFAASIGLGRHWADAILLTLLSIVIVVSIKILGVVLVAAMLVIPGATAYLLTDRFRRFTILSSILGATAGFAGTYLSVVFRVGTGPAIVCVSFGFLLAVFVAAPSHGLLGRWVRHRRLRLRTARENLLASVYRLEERGEAGSDAVPLEKLAAARGETLDFTRLEARKLRGSGWGHVRGDTLSLTAKGRRRAHEVVRIHRLWELFLSREASLPEDHVHPPAEEIEHYLDEDSIGELERLLDHPAVDPHGREIPRAATDSPTKTTKDAEKAR